MSTIQQLTAGKDHVVGKIQSFLFFGMVPDAPDEPLYNIKLILDSGTDVFVQAAKDYIEALTERKDSTATFIGKFVDGNPNILACESIVFWRDENSEPQ